MKKLLTIICLLLAATIVSAQNFEGKVTYRNSYKSKLPNMKDEQFATMMGTKQEYYIKNGNYKSVSDGTFMQWPLYTSNENKLYNKMSNSETVYWNDGSVNADSVISSELNKGVVEILGYKCDELILNCKSGVQKYYFNSKLKLDAKLYEKHKFGNWYEFLKRTNALPLKIIIDNAQFTMESVAVEITPMKVEDKEFKLDANVKTEKSPY